MERLRRRADFVAVAAGRKLATAAFVLQVLGRGGPRPARLGFTVSRKVGTAVERNRVRRRLKEAARRLPPGRLQAGHDYVLIGRRASLKLSFDRMVEELTMALWRLESRRSRPDISAELAGGAIGQSRSETTDR